MRSGHELMAERVRDSLARWSDGGRRPVVIDASSCAHGLISEIGVDGVRGARFDRVGP